MENLLDPPVLVAACLAIGLVVLGVLYARKSRRSRDLGAKLDESEEQARTTAELCRRYEPEARAAAVLRPEIESLKTQLAQLQAQAGAAWELVRRYEPDAQSAPALRGELARYEGLRDAEAELTRVRRETVSLKDEVELTRRAARSEIEALQVQLEELRRDVGTLESEADYQSYGLHAPKYDFENSKQYHERLELVRQKQRDATKEGAAARCKTEWVVGGSASAGRKMTSDWLKLMLRAFNGECDAAVTKVKYNNFAALTERIEKAFEKINKLGTTQQCEISTAYLALKLEELTLFHEYQEKLQEEREEQRLINEQIREEKRALEEIERAKRKAEEEEQRYAEMLEKARTEGDRLTGAKQDKLLRQIAELEGRLQEAQSNKQKLSMAQQTKAGHVYVISNIGSFGENVYKIGMTRRLDPQDRVKELGDASVPFPFDVHAIIATSDAPKLENVLHKTFSARRVNAVNLRREFFSVTLTEIEEVVVRHHGSIEFTRVAEATEWRTSVAMRSRGEQSELPAASIRTGAEIAAAIG